MKIHSMTGLYAVHSVAKCTGGAVAGCPYDFVHPAAARGDEWFALGMKDCGQAIGTEPRMLARPPIVHHGQLLPDIGVEFVRHAPGVFGIVKANLRMRTIAIWFDGRGTASAECHERSRWQRLTEPVRKAGDVPH